MRKALIFRGGWEGHEPVQVGDRFARILREEGFEVDVEDSQDCLSDLAYLESLHLIVPHWTMGSIDGDKRDNVSKAVAGGVGLAGNHGGMCDAFRNDTEWQFMTGGQWVAHPGGVIDYEVNIKKNSSSPIVAGLEDFHVRSEQYYCHVDPAVDVLATTSYPVFKYFHSPNGHVDMPVVWTKLWGHGRVFYNSLGHVDADFANFPTAETLMRRGFLWAAEGRDIARASGARWQDFVD